MHAILINFEKWNDKSQNRPEITFQFNTLLPHHINFSSVPLSQLDDFIMSFLKGLRSEKRQLKSIKSYKSLQRVERDKGIKSIAFELSLLSNRWNHSKNCIDPITCCCSILLMRRALRCWRFWHTKHGKKGNWFWKVDNFIHVLKLTSLCRFSFFSVFYTPLILLDTANNEQCHRRLLFSYSIKLNSILISLMNGNLPLCLSVNWNLRILNLTQTPSCASLCFIYSWIFSSALVND